MEGAFQETSGVKSDSEPDLLADMKSPKRESRGWMREGGSVLEDNQMIQGQKIHNIIVILIWLQMAVNSSTCYGSYLSKMITVVLRIISNDLGAGLCQSITVKYIYIPLVNLW